MFSIKYQDARYSGYICALDWNYGDEKRVWSRSIGLTDGILSFEYTPSIPGLDELAFQSLLSRFGLREWREEIPVELKAVDFRKCHPFRHFSKEIEIVERGKVIILRMSPAQLIAKRREKERLHNLARQEVTSNNLEIDFGKRERILHYAEEYT